MTILVIFSGLLSVKKCLLSSLENVDLWMYIELIKSQNSKSEQVNGIQYIKNCQHTNATHPQKQRLDEHTAKFLGSSLAMTAETWINIKCFLFQRFWHCPGKDKHWNNDRTKKLANKFYHSGLCHMNSFTHVNMQIVMLNDALFRKTLQAEQLVAKNIK